MTIKLPSAPLWAFFGLPRGRLLKVHSEPCMYAPGYLQSNKPRWPAGSANTAAIHSGSGEAGNAAPENEDGGSSATNDQSQHFRGPGALAGSPPHQPANDLSRDAVGLKSKGVAATASASSDSTVALGVHSVEAPSNACRHCTGRENDCFGGWRTCEYNDEAVFAAAVLGPRSHVDGVPSHVEASDGGRNS